MGSTRQHPDVVLAAVISDVVQYRQQMHPVWATEAKRTMVGRVLRVSHLWLCRAVMQPSVDESNVDKTDVAVYNGPALSKIEGESYECIDRQQLLSCLDHLQSCFGHLTSYSTRPEEGPLPSLFAGARSERFAATGASAPKRKQLLSTLGWVCCACCASSTNQVANLMLRVHCTLLSARDTVAHSSFSTNYH